MTVRRLGPADAGAFRDIRLTALRGHPDAYGSTLADWQDRPLAEFEEAATRRYIYGLFDSAGRITGLAAYDRMRGGNERHRALVTAVYVRPEARGQGGAGRLIEAIAAQAVRDGVLQLELHVAANNAAAIAAYRRCGFQAHGTSPRAILCNGRFLDEVLMVCMLEASGAG